MDEWAARDRSYRGFVIIRTLAVMVGILLCYGLVGIAVEYIRGARNEAAQEELRQYQTQRMLLRQYLVGRQITQVFISDDVIHLVCIDPKAPDDKQSFPVSSTVVITKATRAEHFEISGSFLLDPPIQKRAAQERQTMRDVKRDAARMK